MKIFNLFKKKKQKTIIQSFDAASRSRESSKHWQGADFLSADAAVSQPVRKKISANARYESANNGYLAGIVDTLAGDTIGTGPRLQLSTAGDLTEWTEELENAMNRREQRFRLWANAVQLAQKLKIQRIAKAVDGEVFIVKGINPEIQDGIKLDITLFESEQVGSLFDSSVYKYHENGTPEEVDGVFFDKFGNPSGYRFYKIHPGALVNFSNETVIRKASEVIHYQNITRPGQHRGISELQPSLNVFNDLRRYSSAVLSAAETAASISFLLSTDTMAGDDGENGPVPLDPGLIVDFCRNSGVALPAGWKATQLKAEQPTSTHADFVRLKIREASRALSMPLNVALGDSSGYNYASGRLDHQVYHRKIKTERRLIESLILSDLYSEWEKLDKAIYPEDYSVSVDAEWMWDAFSHVDPEKEAKAASERLNVSQTSTLQEECGLEGKDYMKVLTQRVREEFAERKLREKYNLKDTKYE